MAELEGSTVLVVGANGAFGVEFCKQLMSAGVKVIGTATNAETSVSLRSDLHQRLLLDLESSESINTLASFLANSAEPLDGIILASGLVAFGSITDTPQSVGPKLHQVNALGPIQLTSQLVAKLRNSVDLGGSPFIVSISGVIAESPMPGLAAYSSSKTAMHGFAVAAAKELKKLGIRWLDARPGHTDSGLASRSVFGEAPNFGAGMQVPAVVGRIIQAIKEDEKDLPSTSF